MADLNLFNELASAFPKETLSKHLAGEADPKPESKPVAKKSNIILPGSDDDPSDKKKKPEEKKKPVKDEEVDDELQEEEEDKENEEDEEIEPEDDQKDAFRDKLASLLVELQATPPAKEDGKKEEKKEEIVSLKPITFVTDKDLEDEMTADKLNDHLNKVYNAALQDGLRTMSGTVSKMVQDMVDVRVSVAEFYIQNQDLVKYKPVVQLVVEQLQRKNPTWNLSQILQELGKESRKMLGIKAGAQTLKKEEGKKVSFAKLPGSAKVPVAKSNKRSETIGAQISRMMKLR